MYANSIYVIDYFRMFGRGKVRSIVPIVPWEREGSSVVIAKVEFDGGDLGLYEGILAGSRPVGGGDHDPVGAMGKWGPLEQAAFQFEGERGSFVPSMPTRGTASINPAFGSRPSTPSPLPDCCLRTWPTLADAPGDHARLIHPPPSDP